MPFHDGSTMQGWSWEKKWSPGKKRFYWYNRAKNIAVWSLEDI